jgi:hypothetical protein
MGAVSHSPRNSRSLDRAAEIWHNEPQVETKLHTGRQLQRFVNGLQIKTASSCLYSLERVNVLRLLFSLLLVLR